MVQRSVEQTYQKKNLHEHILSRPDSYIGSIKVSREELWVASENNNLIVKKTIDYIPGLLKIFDEILVNAIDHTVRDKTAKSISVEINDGIISVKNDGNGVPVVLHEEYGVYVPELIFGNLLTSSNYNDTDQRVVGGVNGYGSKVSNIYSEFMTIETVDSERKLKYIQTFKNNMFDKGNPKVSNCSGKPYTKITFKPDYNKFGIKNLSDDIFSIMKRRVLDTTAVTNNKVSVSFNGTVIKSKEFQNYVKMYPLTDNVIFDKIEEGPFIWEYAVCVDPESNSFNQVSFVNGINTILGGKHVDYILNQIVKKLSILIETKKKITNIKPSYIKDRLFLFVRATVVNPSFSNQSKDTLTTPVKDFGISLEVSETFMNKLYKSGIVEDIISFTNYKNQKSLGKKSDGKKKSKISIPKLEDANFAGTSKSKMCSLILTEGDSAKTFAVSGFSVVGRDRYGCFPLRGKCVSEDTLIPMWNGINKKAKFIRIGDEVIGDDGNKRSVITLHKDSGKMYEVFQENGESYKVNNRHILTLKFKKHKKIYFDSTNLVWKTRYWDGTVIKTLSEKVFVPIKCKECGFCLCITELKKHYKDTHVNYTFKKYNVKLDSPAMAISYQKIKKTLEEIDISNIVDIPIEDYLNLSKSDKNRLTGFRVKSVEWPYQKITEDPYKVGGSLIIPSEYLVNSRNIRLKVLAGVLNTVDYNYCKKFLEFSVVFLEKRDLNNLLFLIRSLGIRAKSILNRNNNYTIRIAGNLNEIPTIVMLFATQNNFDDDCTGNIYIQNTSNCNYVGIGITGNHRFLIGDFTVTHNCLNVREATQSQLLNNAELISIKKILGLQQNKVYKTVDDLRYGSIIILTDADYDGVHIQGLIMNMLHVWWPELLEIKGFIRKMKTPIVKATKGSVSKEFYSIKNYKDWEESINNKSWDIKYYKGLGTSTAKEAKSLFSRIDENMIDYTSVSPEETRDFMLLAFEKKQADVRKEWLKSFNKDSVLDQAEKNITYADFVDKDLIHFSMYDNIRSIPSICDGLKPSQRKILYTLFSKNYKKEIKVAQFGAAVAEFSSYHHGEQSLYGAIINMAQNFMGSNNINLLKPNGQFGSRLSSSDAASPRYIFTEMSSITSKLFLKDDFDILEDQYDDGNKTEPLFYMPVMPLILINGCQGIGTGYSTFVPCFNPDDISENIKRILKGEPLKEMVPWYKNFKGKIVKTGEGSFSMSGIYERQGDLSIKITELPVGVWTNEYKEYLEKLDETNDSIHSIINRSSEVEVEFEIKFNNKVGRREFLENNPDKVLKMVKSISTRNMHLFDEHGSIKKYDTAEEILEKFVSLRMKYNVKRKENILEKYNKEYIILSNKIRFLTEIMDDKFCVYRRAKKDILCELSDKKYSKVDNSYDYIMNLPIYSFTDEKISDLQTKLKAVELKVKSINKKTSKSMFLEDISELK